MYKQDLSFNDIQWLIWRKIKPNETKPIYGSNSFENYWYWIGIRETILLFGKKLLFNSIADSFFE